MDDSKSAGIPMERHKRNFEAAIPRAATRNSDKDLRILSAKPREELSKWAPRIVSMRINRRTNPRRHRSGRKNNQRDHRKCNVQIDIEDDGLVMITSVDPEGMEKAVAWMKQLTREIRGQKFSTGPDAYHGLRCVRGNSSETGRTCSYFRSRAL